MKRFTSDILKEKKNVTPTIGRSCEGIIPSWCKDFVLSAQEGVLSEHLLSNGISGIVFLLIRSCMYRYCMYTAYVYF